MKDINIVDGGSYHWSTDEYHPDNSFTMTDFLINEFSDDTGFELIYLDGSFAEVQSRTDGKIFAVNASGDGDSFNHKVTFELI
jgi:hypothetical protein